MGKTSTGAGGKPTVSTAVAAPIRTVIQGTPAWAITEFLDAFGIVHMDERQFGVTVLLLTAIIASLQNLVENAQGWGFLRRVPPTDTPV
jgi:hypothetical protein